MVDNTATACTLPQDDYNTNDGKSLVTAPKDAYNIVLNYYQNDYNSINTLSPSVSIPAQLGSEYRPLYNGNISSMAVNIDKLQSPILYNYKYDQLNRLVQMDAFKSNNANWAVLTKQLNYHEGISYDANGNILRYQRNGNNAANQVMDNLTYNYKTGTNKLDYIDDAIPMLLIIAI